MGKQLRKINKEWLGKPVESTEALTLKMEKLGAYAVVRQIQMLSFDEDEPSSDLYVYRVYATLEALSERKGVERLTERVFKIPVYRSTWPFQ